MITPHSGVLEVTTSPSHHQIDHMSLYFCKKPRGYNLHDVLHSCILFPSRGYDTAQIYKQRHRFIWVISHTDIKWNPQNTDNRWRGPTEKALREYRGSIGQTNLTYFLVGYAGVGAATLISLCHLCHLVYYVLMLCFYSDTDRRVGAL